MNEIPPVDKIIQKIMKNRIKNKSQLTDRYCQQIAQDSRITNYELQDKNLQLRKQLKKLQTILNKKTKIKSKIDQTNSQIQQLRQKLKSVLKVNQSLEMSIIKFKPLLRQKSKQQNIQNCCCCSRSKRSKSRHKISNIDIKISNNQSLSKRELVSDSSLMKISKRKDVSKSRRVKNQMKQAQVQCDLNYLLKQKQNIEEKKQHISRLKQLIQSQNNLLKQYEQKTTFKQISGKIIKVNQLKSNAIMKTCASVGCITKTSRLKAAK